MSDSEEQEPNLYLRKQSDGEENEEEWDDSNIIAAYDKVVSAVKRKLTKKIQRELGLKDEDVEEFLSDAKSSDSKSKKDRNGEMKKSKKKRWAVGSSCRAVYSEDGEEYEAVIVKMLDSNWAVVRFVGYENEEEILLEELTPSLGKSVVQAQMEAASQAEELQEALEEGELDSTSAEVPEAEFKSGLRTEFPKCSEDRARDVPTLTFEPTLRRFPMTFPVFPVPPPPVMMSKGPEVVKRQDDVNAMLMSWYMCGYYTGLYERGQQLEKN